MWFATTIKSLTKEFNLQRLVQVYPSWSGFPRHRSLNSHDSEQIPILQCKICPPLSEFTNMATEGP
jgi:hypothetical protein